MGRMGEGWLESASDADPLASGSGLDPLDVLRGAVWKKFLDGVPT